MQSVLVILLLVSCASAMNLFRLRRDATKCTAMCADATAKCMANQNNQQTGVGNGNSQSNCNGLVNAACGVGVGNGAQIGVPINAAACLAATAACNTCLSNPSL